jgi:hypothetical protein
MAGSAAAPARTALVIPAATPRLPASKASASVWTLSSTVPSRRCPPGLRGHRDGPDRLTRAFALLFEDLSATWPKQDIEFAEEEVGYNEFGVALEDRIGAGLQNGKGFTSDQIRQIEEPAATMRMQDPSYLDQLREAAAAQRNHRCCRWPCRRGLSRWDTRDHPECCISRPIGARWHSAQVAVAHSTPIVPTRFPPGS